MHGRAHKDCWGQVGVCKGRHTDIPEDMGMATRRPKGRVRVSWSVFTLAAWQSAHPEMNLQRKVDIPGHQ